MTKEQLNDIVVSLFHEISYQEEKAVITAEFKDISNKELHIIDAIGAGSPKNMSSIAKALNITVGTLTIAINSLLKKGYVIRKRGEQDRRIVYISLSDKGREAFEHHRKFHRDMLEDVLSRLDDDEERLLIRIMEYFRDYYEIKNI
ncbi:MarR family winged helix-turn-helix transcriptional regulator [Anaerostipes sp.]|uniref:MarR family winged helix-turn-helix transcriptional regulator n=1 Tax=Anaerostipes sp. TaxID=1872530 RepID=UPI0025BCBFBC|nr:MarR family transcriptional regulator [Anaerostipes sp.]MBS7008832.1 MarR family transcriptional regulator [Anaerostipes sp.]